MVDTEPAQEIDEAPAGVATGIGEGPAYRDAFDPPPARDPHVRELTLTLSKLAEAVRRRGEAGLQATPQMTRFEATLRAYCVGYLAGRRAEPRDPPEAPEQ